MNNTLDSEIKNLEDSVDGLLDELIFLRKRNAELMNELMKFERDARRWRWIEDRLAYHQIPGQMAEGWTLDEIYPGEDAGKAIDSFIRHDSED